MDGLKHAVSSIGRKTMKTRITEMLGIEYPIIQGGMAWVAEHNLAAGVSAAGGLGLIGGANAPGEVVREEIRKARALTDRPIGVNVMLLSPHADDVARVVVEEGIKVVTTGAGNPEKYMQMWKEAGVKVIPVVASVALARRMEKYGADAVIAEGTESGGHIGEETTMTLVPQVVDAVSIPVIAAGNLENLKPVENKPNYKFVKGDIADRAFIFDLFEKEKPDMVVNFAAESHVDRSITDPEAFVRTNVMGTTTLLDACRTYGIKRYHQVSTDEVYGDLPLDRPDLFFTETTPLHTSSPYSSSKASADLFVLAYHRTYGLPVTVSRCSNNYGPYHFPEKLIPLIISRALANEELPVYGTGENVRDWLHVADHCEAIDLVIHKGREGEVYNIGGHNERTNLEVVKTILKALDKPESLIRFVTDRPGHDMRYAIDPTKIETELGWKPKYNFDTGIEQTIQWYLDNQDWWKNILSGEYSSYFDKMYGNRL